MSTTELPSRLSITESGESVYDCPPGIEDQLKKAAFEKVGTNVYVKKRQSWDGDDEYTVVKARLDGDELTISVKDIVGIVDLTPTSRLQIKPKIGWDEILEMFLTVNRYNRSLDYYGVPIKDFLSDDIGIEDIFIVIAVNYLNSLQPIRQNGFIRQFQTQRKDAMDARGRIDIERSLQNLETGNPKHHYVQKVVDYNTPVNALIHCGGIHLLQLFQKSAQDHTNEEYFRIFSDLYDAVNDLAEMGINGMANDVTVYQEITSGQLPRQRAYYKRAIDISKMILSSATGRSLESGDEELTMDYLFNMNNLFEEFSQIVLEEELRALRENPLYHGFDNIRVESKPVLRPYSDTRQARHQPDHVLYNGNDPIAVLDSKYYQEGRDPSMIRSLRSQMFSYAFLLDVNQIAFLYPEGRSQERALRERDGEVAVVCSPPPFATTEYRDAVRTYLVSVLEEVLEESQVIADIRDHGICHSDIGKVSMEDALAATELKLTGFGSLSRSIIDNAIRTSPNAPARRNLPRHIQFGHYRALRQVLSDNQEYDRCLPVFIPESAREVENDDENEEDNQWEGDALRLHFITQEKGGHVSNVKTHDCFPLDWKGELDRF